MKKLVIIIACFFITNLLFAQPEIESGEVEIIKNFEAQLLEAHKLKIAPALPPLDTTTQRLTYNLPQQISSVDYPAPTIKPIAMKSEKLPDMYKGFAKVGYGIPNQIYGEASYFTKVQDNIEVGGKLHHHSADNSNNLDNQRFSRTGGEVEGTYYFLEQGFALGANLGLEERNRFFYGYDHDLETFDKEDVRRRFREFDIGAKFFNGERTQGDLNYNASIDFYRLSDNLDSDENGTLIEVGLTKYIAEKHPLGAEVILDFTNYTSADTRTQNLNNYTLRPFFGFHQDRFKIDLGANIISHQDEFTIYPDIEASVNILGTRLAAFAGWEGNFIKNNFQNLSNYNPYISSQGFDIRNTEYQEYYGGIKGNVSVVDYYGKIGLKNANNLALFVQDITDDKRFDILYDTAQIVNIEGTVNLNLLKDLELGGTLRYNIFDMAFQERPWGLPAIETNITTRYKMLSNKLLLKADWYTANGIPYVFYENGEAFNDRLNTLFDMSLGAEYWINKNFAAFADVNNLFGNKRERWQNYPMLGLNVLVGITGRF